jgi:hypothetical protein
MKGLLISIASDGGAPRFCFNGAGGVEMSGCYNSYKAIVEIDGKLKFCRFVGPDDIRDVEDYDPLRAGHSINIIKGKICVMNFSDWGNSAVRDHAWVDETNAWDQL